MRAGLALLLLVLGPSARAAAGDLPHGNVAKGQDIYDERCTLCHVPEGQGQGPSLNGVVGRKAASLPGFPYTAALKASGLTWAPATLNAFLAAPTRRVPGTAMAISVPDAEERADLIAFLATQK